MTYLSESTVLRQIMTSKRSRKSNFLWRKLHSKAAYSLLKSLKNLPLLDIAMQLKVVYIKVKCRWHASKKTRGPNIDQYFMDFDRKLQHHREFPKLFHRHFNESKSNMLFVPNNYRIIKNKLKNFPVQSEVQFCRSVQSEVQFYRLMMITRQCKPILIERLIFHKWNHDQLDFVYLLINEL